MYALSLKPDCVLTRAPANAHDVLFMFNQKMMYYVNDSDGL